MSRYLCIQIRNTARSKSNPLMCTHVDAHMFSTLHPPGLADGRELGNRCEEPCHKLVVGAQLTEPREVPTIIDGRATCAHYRA